MPSLTHLPFLVPPNNTMLQVGQALQAVTEGAGDDEDLRAAAAAATGAFAKYCR